MSVLLLQNGGALLLQDGGHILLTAETTPAATQRAGSGPGLRGPHSYSTDDLRAREEDEILLLS